MTLPRNVILVGFMASGKTSVGRALAARTGWPLVDADDVIVARAGKPIHRIFAEDGEPAFRELERQVIADLCAGERQVIASGGGAFVDPQNREVMLAGGRVFFLSASPAEILRRVQQEDAGGPIRPLLAVDDPEARIAELLAQRAAAYAQAHHTVETDALTPEGVAARIREVYGMEHIEFVGVDGCSLGWFGVGYSGNGAYEMMTFRTFVELLNQYREAQLILVDIPIGLPEGEERRHCDGIARGHLGSPRSSSVFTAPTRQTVRQAEQFPTDYPAARALERQVTGRRGISQQAFAIAPKIAEVERVILARGADAIPQIREVHSEVCFWALNNQHPMNHRKKNMHGVTERIGVLGEVEARTEEIYNTACRQYRRNRVARDDILDALVAAVTAYLGHDQLQTLPANPPRDAKRLPMEMVYWIP